MSNKNQIRILRNISAAIYFVTQVFGLWPYNLDKSRPRIKCNSLKCIYSIILPFIVLYNYYTFGVVELASSRSTSSNFVHSNTMNLITDFYAIFIIFSYASLYVGQHLKFRISESVYFKFVDIIELLKTFPTPSVDLRKYFVNFFIKTIVFDVFNLLVLWYNLSRSSNVVASHPFLPLFLYTPVMAVRLYENVFYGGVLFVDLVFKQLNKSLLKIVLMQKTGEICRKKNIDKYCQLSDELDKLSTLHFKLSETIKAINSIFDVQLLLWMVLQLAGLTIRCFYQYVGIAHLLNSQGNYKLVVGQNFITLVITFSTWIEILLTSYACESLVTEVLQFIDQ